jgi:Fur family peroxide stress response transcriptional regulator
MPTISLATVYNCLETLVQCRLIRQVNRERSSTRYCPNLHPHAHFHDEETGEIHDIDLSDPFLEQLKKLLPGNFCASAIEITFLGKIDQPARDQPPATATPRLTT